MSDVADSESQIGRDNPEKTAATEQTPLSVRAKMCLTASGLVLLAGLLIGFGVVDWYTSLWNTHPFWNSVLTAAIVLGLGLIFDRTRAIAGRTLLGGSLLIILLHMAAFSGYGWYMFFTTGMDIEGKVPLIVSRTAGALIFAGVVMLVVCYRTHFNDDDEPILLQAAAGLAYVIMFTAFAIFVLTLLSVPMRPESSKIILADTEILTLKDCTVTEGTKVMCYLPESVREGSTLP